jgi:cytosine/adenosine deaminase-related metal-dependent hydrolase
VTYVITEGDEQEDSGDYRVIDVLGAERLVDLSAWREEFNARYRFPTEEELGAVDLDHYNNLLLQGIDLMRAEGYTDTALSGNYVNPRLASLFAAWLVREGLIPCIGMNTTSSPMAL